MRKKLSGHFFEDEFRCRCKRADCDAPPMRRELIQKLELVRVEWGKPLIPVSGRRCAFWNDHIGGAKKSQHLLGNAVDFYLAGPVEVQHFIVLAVKYGFTGIGHGIRRIHIDDRKQPAIWTY